MQHHATQSLLPNPFPNPRFSTLYLCSPPRNYHSQPTFLSLSNLILCSAPDIHHLFPLHSRALEDVFCFHQPLNQFLHTTSSFRREIASNSFRTILTALLTPNSFNHYIPSLFSSLLQLHSHPFTHSINFNCKLPRPRS